MRDETFNVEEPRGAPLRRRRRPPSAPPLRARSACEREAGGRRRSAPGSSLRGVLVVDPWSLRPVRAGVPLSGSRVSRPQVSAGPHPTRRQRPGQPRAAPPAPGSLGRPPPGPQPLVRRPRGGSRGPATGGGAPRLGSGCRLAGSVDGQSGAIVGLFLNPAPSSPRSPIGGWPRSPTSSLACRRAGDQDPTSPPRATSAAAATTTK